MCHLLGVSRPSVREALRELESEGLVNTIPFRGPLVTTLTAEDARSIYEVRGVLEALAARLFAEKASPEQIRELSDTVDQLESVYATHDVEQILVAKKAFYDVLLDGSQNVIIPSLLRTMNARITQLRRVSLSNAKRLPGSIKEIRAVRKPLEIAIRKQLSRRRCAMLWGRRRLQSRSSRTEGVARNITEAGDVGVIGLDHRALC